MKNKGEKVSILDEKYFIEFNTFVEECYTSVGKPPTSVGNTPTSEDIHSVYKILYIPYTVGKIQTAVLSNDSRFYSPMNQFGFGRFLYMTVVFIYDLRLFDGLRKIS